MSSTAKDARWLRRVSSTNLFQHVLANWTFRALQTRNYKFTSKQKKFMQMMIREHQQAHSQLIALASHLGVIHVNLMSNAHRTLLSDMKDGSYVVASEIWHAYRSLTIRTHKQAIKIYEHEISFGKNRSVQKLARSQIKSVRKHLRESLAV